MIRALAIAVALHVITTPARAQQQAAAPEAAVVTGGLGRLFHTPERRATLDRQRELNIQEAAPKSEDPTVTVSGVVRRSAGPETAWINGVPQTSRDPDVIWSRTRHPGRVNVVTSDQEQRQVSVGETLYRSSGTIDSPLRGGTVDVYRPPQSGVKPPRP